MKLHPNARTTPRSRAIIVERVQRGWTRAEAAEAASISLRTVDKWLRRFRQHGHLGLNDRSSAPRHQPRKTPKRLVDRIRRLRSKRLTAEQIAAVLGRAVSTVCAVLKRIGLARLRDLDPRR